LETCPKVSKSKTEQKKQKKSTAKHGKEGKMSKQVNEQAATHEPTRTAVLQTKKMLVSKQQLKKTGAASLKIIAASHRFTH
jgi:hypothetical protein